MEESAISIFKKLPETKAQIKNYSRLVRESLENGEVEPLRFIAMVKALENLTKELTKDLLIKDIVLEEAEKFGTKSFDKGNANFRVQEVGTKYDYSVCMDSEYELICSEADKWNTKKKDREDFLKAIKPDQEIFGSDGVQILPPHKTSTTSVVVTIK